MYPYFWRFSYCLLVSIQPVMAAENETGDAATAFFNSAEQFLKEKNYIRAIEFFDKALASNTTMIAGQTLFYTRTRTKRMPWFSWTITPLPVPDHWSGSVNLWKWWISLVTTRVLLSSNSENTRMQLNAYDKVLQINNQSVPAWTTGEIRISRWKIPGCSRFLSPGKWNRSGNSYAAAALEKAQRALAEGKLPITSPSQTLVATLPTMIQTTPVTPTDIPPALPTKTQLLSPLCRLWQLSLPWDYFPFFWKSDKRTLNLFLAKKKASVITGISHL